MAEKMSNGDLERLHGAVLQAESARNYYFRELRRKEAEVSSLRDAFAKAEDTYRQLKAQADAQEVPALPPTDDDMPM